MKVCKRKKYTHDQRGDLQKRIQFLVKKHHLRKTDIEHAIGLTWAATSRLVDGLTLPREDTCERLEEFLASAEQEFGVKRK